MMRWLIIALVAYILYKLVTNEMRKRDAAQTAAKTHKAPTGDMVKDPICGSYVDVASSVSVRDGDTVHRFCSYECRDTFLEQLRGTGRKIPGQESAKADAKKEDTQE